MAVAAGLRRTVQLSGPAEDHGQIWGIRSVFYRDERSVIFWDLQLKMSDIPWSTYEGLLTTWP